MLRIRHLGYRISVWEHAPDNWRYCIYDPLTMMRMPRREWAYGFDFQSEASALEGAKMCADDLNGMDLSDLDEEIP